MARRRRREDDLVWPVAQLAGLVVLASMLIPGIRQMLFSIWIIALAFLGIVVVGLVIFGVCRLATPERNMRGMTSNVFAPPSHVPDQKCDD